MEYTEIRFYCEPAQNEILIAWLGTSDYDMFEESEDGLKAYIPSEHYSEDVLNSLLSSIPNASSIRREKKIIEEQNWNSQWESNFQPVCVAGKIHIRAPFHPTENYETEVIIEPKMSFGTGHHSTTYMMAELMLSLEIEDKSLLDMGCGSGILAILASKFKAAKIMAIDNDSWAIENCQENCMRNQAEHILIKKGESELLEGLKFDIILANINRNVLLSDISLYNNSLNPNGRLLLSGFLSEDRTLILDKALQHSLILENEVQRLNWLAMQFKKS